MTCSTPFTKYRLRAGGPTRAPPHGADRFQVCGLPCAPGHPVILGKHPRPRSWRSTDSHLRCQGGGFSRQHVPGGGPVLGRRCARPAEVLGSPPLSDGPLQGPGSKPDPCALEAWCCHHRPTATKAAIEPARRFRELGFRLMATEGITYLKAKGIDCNPGLEAGVGRPKLVTPSERSDPAAGEHPERPPGRPTAPTSAAQPSSTNPLHHHDRGGHRCCERHRGRPGGTTQDPLAAAVPCGYPVNKGCRDKVHGARKEYDILFRFFYLAPRALCRAPSMLTYPQRGAPNGGNSALHRKRTASPTCSTARLPLSLGTRYGGLAVRIPRVIDAPSTHREQLLPHQVRTGASGFSRRDRHRQSIRTTLRPVQPPLFMGSHSRHASAKFVTGARSTTFDPLVRGPSHRPRPGAYNRYMRDIAITRGGPLDKLPSQ